MIISVLHPLQAQLGWHAPLEDRDGARLAAQAGESLLGRVAVAFHQDPLGVLDHGSSAVHLGSAAGAALGDLSQSGIVRASMPRGSEHAAFNPISIEQIRRRVRLMVQISARPGVYRRGLETAAERLTPQEASVLADLEHHGLDVVQLRDVLRGAHVLVDDPSLYERWQFPKVSHERISSHHHEIDKHTYPDFGMQGPLLREKLHGRTAHGTWVQLEKTPVAPGKRPSWVDLVHLADYVIYRVTRSNIGPWGRSADTEKRPMYLSPDLRARVPLPKAASDELTRVVSRLEESDDTTSASPDLVARFPPPERADDLRELTFTGEVQGRGLFAGSDVWITRTAARTAKELLRRDVEPPGWAPPPVASGQAQTAEIDGERTIRYAARTEADQPQEEHR